MLQTNELLDRLELLYPENTLVSDLRKAILNDDRYALFRVIKHINDTPLTDAIRKSENLDDLRKAILNDDRYALFRVIKHINDTPLTDAIRKSENLDNFDTDSFSRGQIKSKKWLVNELEKLNLDLRTVFLCAGWYATLAAMLFESRCKIDKIRSFDIDESCADIADTINKKYVLDNWKFKASTLDIHSMSYPLTYTTFRANKTSLELTNNPDTIINTSCEHIENFADWYEKIPQGKIVVLQTNDYFEITEHINCSESLEQFAQSSPMTTVLYQGELELPKYKRFMRIGIK